MVNKLQFLRSLTPGNSPVGLSSGEIAFNLTDKKLFIGNGSDTITRLNGSTESVTLGTGYFESDLTTLSANAYTDQKIADLVDSAPALLNTLNELAAAIGDDANFVTTITNSVSTVQTNLNNENARALAAEGAISANLAAEISRAQAAEADLAADLAAEASRAAAAESALEADLAAEEARALAAEGVLQSNINSEAATRAAADNALAADLAAEEARAQAAEAAIQAAGTAAIAAENARALAAEAALSARITDIENGVDLGTF